MSKKIKIAAIVVVVAAMVGLLVFIALDGGNPEPMQQCALCEGAGVVSYDTVCENCDVSSETHKPGCCNETEDHSDCAVCNGTLTVEVDGACASCGKETAEHDRVCCVCAGTGKVEAESHYYATWIALLAPVIAIVLALITKEVYSSLMIGVIVGGLFAFNFDPVKTVDGVIQNGVIDAISGTAGIFAFLVILGIMVALINQAGGSAAFGRWAAKNIKSRTGAMLCTFILGVLIFIDDYFNCLTVGGVMRPVTDAHKVSRAKLAFIIDATAAPICMIAPISSWAAAVSEYAPEGVSGISMFVQAIPYNLYSLLTIGFVLMIILMKVDYGPMKRHEKRALSGDMAYGADMTVADEAEYNHKGRVMDLILPVAVLVVSCVVALVYVGGFFDPASECYMDFIEAFGNTDATVGLPLGGFVSLVFTIIYLILRRIVAFKGAMECIPKGFMAMVPAILILTLATALKNMTGLLGADAYVGELMANAEGLANFLPAIIFLVAIGLSFSTGTSWGTFGILIPIVIAIFENQPELQIIGMSACLAGSVCGDHCSPISDTTIMSSAGARCNHVDHVSTQLPYALTVAAVSFAGYILAGFVQNVFVVLGVSFVVLTAVMVIIKLVLSKKKG